MNLRRLPLYASVFLTLFGFSGCKKEKSTEPKVNHGPIIQRVIATPSEPFIDQRVILECRAVDEDNDDLDYIWYSNKGGTFDRLNDSLVHWTPLQTPQEYTFIVSVDDNRGGHDSKSLDLRVVSRFDTLIVSDDAFTFEKSPNRNSHVNSHFSSILELSGLESGDGLADIYLKFGQINITRRIESVILQLNSFQIGIQEGTYSDVYKISEPWNELELTYNNRPIHEFTPVKRFIMPNINGILSLDITDLVNYWINNPSGNYGIMISPLEEKYRVFLSKEGFFDKSDVDSTSCPPRIIVKYSN